MYLNSTYVGIKQVNAHDLDVMIDYVCMGKVAGDGADRNHHNFMFRALYLTVYKSHPLVGVCPKVRHIKAHNLCPSLLDDFLYLKKPNLQNGVS